MRKFLNFKFSGVFFLLMVFNASASSTSEENTSSYLITNVVISNPQSDAADVSANKPTDVFIKNGRIVKIGQNLSHMLKGTPRVINAEGLFLAPGLIDSHTHLSGVPGMTMQQEQAFPEVAQAALNHKPLSYLYYGFTTLIDLNSDSQSITQWNEQVLRPQAYFCAAAPVMDGYPTQFIPKQYRYDVVPNFIVDESHRHSFPSDLKFDEHSPKAVVKRIKDDGAICVKTHYESGFGGHGQWPVPSISLLQDLVSQAHQVGLPLVLHANSQQAQQAGVDAGVDAFVHGMWTWNDNTQTKPTPEIVNLLNRVIQQGIKQQPTVQVLYGEMDLHNPDYLQQPQIKQAMPEILRQWYLSEAGQQATIKASERPWAKSMLEKGQWQLLSVDAIERVLTTANYIAEREPELMLFGSDTPSDLTYANPTGLNGNLELLRWQQAGISVLTRFQAATINNAKFFGLEHDIGSVHEGKRADLLLLSKDPRIEYDAFNTIQTVMINGKPVARETLSALAH
ncbi:amidohydrolase family protein [Alteromonadaceae bacterium BrNp21-10]|nr:amidohydrolase family protein [Alteromonadaceae bacterium BrNp21-10]